MPDLSTRGILIYIVIVIIAGLTLMVTGELYQAVREIALNTRKAEQGEQSSYPGLRNLGSLFVTLGWCVIILGIGVPLVSIVIPKLSTMLPERYSPGMLSPQENWGAER